MYDLEVWSDLNMYLHSLHNVNELLHEQSSNSGVDEHPRWLPYLALR